MCLKGTDQPISRNCKVVVVHTHRYVDLVILPLACAHNNFVVTKEHTRSAQHSYMCNVQYADKSFVHLAAGIR